MLSIDWIFIIAVVLGLIGPFAGVISEILHEDKYYHAGRAAARGIAWSFWILVISLVAAAMFAGPNTYYFLVGSGSGIAMIYGAAKQHSHQHEPQQ